MIYNYVILVFALIFKRHITFSNSMFMFFNQIQTQIVERIGNIFEDGFRAVVALKDVLEDLHTNYGKTLIIIRTWSYWKS